MPDPTFEQLAEAVKQHSAAASAQLATLQAAVILTAAHRDLGNEEPADAAEQTARAALDALDASLDYFRELLK